jgi:hypothetical protein
MAHIGQDAAQQAQRVNLWSAHAGRGCGGEAES